MKDYRINFQLPAVSPGPAIKQEKPEQACEFREFETKVYGAARLGEVAHQVRGIGSVVGDRPPHDAHGSVAAPPQSKWTPKVGDRVEVWEGGKRNLSFGPGTVVSIDKFVRVDHDYATLSQYRFGAGWSAASLRPLEPIDTSPAPSGWVEHDGRWCERWQLDRLVSWRTRP